MASAIALLGLTILDAQWQGFNMHILRTDLHTSTFASNKLMTGLHVQQLYVCSPWTVTYLPKFSIYTKAW